MTILRIQSGLLAFPRHTQYYLHWHAAPYGTLESESGPNFVVIDPAAFFPDYAPAVGESTRLRLNIHDPSQIGMLAILNRRGEAITANLQGPIIYNKLTGDAEQLVLVERLYTTRHPLPQEQCV